MSIRSRMKAHMRLHDEHCNESLLDHNREVSTYGATPNAAVTAKLGALCLDTATEDIYINTDGASAWTKIVD